MSELQAGRAFLDLVPRLKPGYRSDVERELGSVDGGRAGANVGAKFSDGLKRAALAGGGLLAAKIGVDFFKGTIDSASDLAETVSKSNTIFGANAAEIESWAGRADTAIGQTKQQALDAAANYGNLFQQLGIGSKQAAGLSTSMVELASDFASFHNADVSEVLNAQSAAFRGEYDAVQRFVPTINAAAVEQRALADSGKKATSELTAQEKALAVQKLLMEGAGAATGDFARTSDGLANKQRILSARLENVKAKIGAALLPVVTKLVGFLADNLEPTLAKVSRGFEIVSAIVQQVAKIIFQGDFTGGPFAEDSPFVNSLFTVRELFIDKILPAVSMVADFIGNNLKPILIGLAATVAILISPVGAVVAALVLAYQRFEAFRNIVDAVIRFIAEQVAPRVGIFVAYIAEQFGALVGWVREHWAAIQEAIGHVVVAVQAVIETWVRYLGFLWSTFGDDLLRVAGAVWAQIQNIITTAVDLVRGVIELGLALINGDWGAAWDAVKGIISTAKDFIVETVKNLFTLLSGIFGGALDGLETLVSGALDMIVGFFSGVGGRISRVAGGMFDSVKNAFKSAINWIIRAWNGLEFKIPGFDPPGPGPSFGGFTLGVPNIRELWQGGTATSPGLAIVGDRGAELLDLSKGATVTPLNTARMIAEGALAAREDASGPGVVIERLEVPTAVDATADEVVDAIGAKLGWRLTTRKDR